MSDPSMPPDAWQAFGRQLHQDFTTCHPDVVDGIRGVLAGMPNQQREEVLVYLRHLASDAVGPRECVKLWLASGAGFVPAQRDARAFLQAIIEAFEGAR